MIGCISCTAARYAEHFITTSEMVSEAVEVMVVVVWGWRGHFSSNAFSFVVVITTADAIKGTIFSTRFTSAPFYHARKVDDVRLRLIFWFVIATSE